MLNTKRLTNRLASCIFALLALNTSGVQAATATRTSSFTYDAASGLLTKEIIEPGNSQLCLVTLYTYDVFGNKTSTTTRNCNGSTGEAAAPAAGTDGVIVSRVTSSTYDAKGRFATSTTNALGHTESRTFDDRFGTVASLTGPNLLTTSWTYDNFGRKTLETRADGTTTEWMYNKPCSLSNGDLTQAKYCIASYSTGDGYRYKRNYYDSLNRKLATTRIDFTNNAWIDDGRVDYDAQGRVAKSYLSYERGYFASAKYSTLTYDILGRIKTETAPDNSVATKSYAGMTTTETNALNQTRVTVKNSQGQISSVKDAQNKTVSYSYDPFGNLKTTTDALGNITTLTYDTRGRKTGMNDPDMGVWAYAYNALGELIRQVDAKAQTVTMQYDKLGRMTSRNEPGLISTWVFDTATKGIGKLASASSSNGYSRTHSYDTLGRPSSTSTVIDNPAAPYVTSVTYDSAGRVLTQTYPTGFAIKNVYNAVGYLSQVVNGTTPTTVYWTANALDAQGHLTQQTYGNGIVTQQVYYPDTGRLKNQYAGAGNAVQNMSYQYDDLGNLQTRTDTNNNLVETYLYDALNRVTTATATSGAVNTTTTFAYDTIGNIICKSDISACSQAAPNYTYNASGAGSIRPHAVASITGTVNGVVNPAYSYDANGNMLSGAGRTTVWTSFNMPGQITNGTKTAAFWYNAEHERIKELQADQSIVITLSPRYDTGLHFEKKYIAANGTLTGAVEYEHYLYAGGLMFGQYVTRTGTDGVTIVETKTKYYSKDHLGSIVAITDGNGAVIERLSYDVWGKRRYPNGAADPNGLLRNPDMYHGYTGHEMLDDVGLIHMNGRLYDPVVARFVSADPTIQAQYNLQSYNRYTYGWNNPLGGADPSGYSWLEDRWFEAWHNQNFQAVVTIAIAAYVSPEAAAVYTAAVTARETGSVEKGIQAGLISYATASAFEFAGDYTSGISNVAAHAAVGCASAEASGGNCGAGAAAAAAGSMWSNYGVEFNSLEANVVAHAVVGGVASELGGGKFANGAITGAFGYLFNQRTHKNRKNKEKSEHVLENAKSLEGDDVLVNAKGNAECVELIKQKMNAPASSTWDEGRPLTQGANIPEGTAIATFVDGTYPSKSTGNHAAIFLEQSKDGIVVLEQYRKLDVIQIRVIPWNPAPGASPSNNGSAYSTILW